MTDDDKKALEGLDAILDGKPLKHNCENCDDVGMAAAHELPPGWRYLAATDKLFESLDQVDAQTLLLCPICYGLVTRVINKLQP